MAKRSLSNIIKKVFLLNSLMVLLFAMFAGCGKSDVNCFNSNGKVIRQGRNVPDFDSIDVADYVNLILSQDTVNRVAVESGENIIDAITTEVTANKLYIRNNNKCNWVRSYNIPVNVIISVKNLQKIYYNCSGNITTSNTLKSYQLVVEVWGGCGTINMDIDVFQAYFVEQMGTADFNIHGHCPIFTLYSGDYGLFQCKDLATRYTYVTNNGSNDCYVKSTHYLEATIGSIGNIYYTGNPDTLYVYDHGKGEVIPF
jgi:hypothetical protein